ncbi:MAG: LmbE family protein, partial [Bacteroidota bacterium]
AYIMGSGDEVPVALEQIGYQVDMLADDQITVDKLKQYDAVIAGIRAYNTNARMPYHETEILKYVEQGGTYIVQYMTTRSLSKQPGPYPLKISRQRTTDEDAEMKFLAPDHPIVNSPNKLSKVDFEGWVQERGLYYPGEWDDKYTPIFASADRGEDPVKGGLLVAEYGKGYFMYSGLSFFRELPAGVPGAYRLIANMISIGK